MRSDHYWSKRAEWRMYGYIQESDKVADEISKAYARAATYLDEESKKVFETFRRKGGISEAEARRILKDCGNATNYEGLKKAYAKLDDPEIRKQMLAGLRSPAFRARIQRLEDLRKSLDRQCADVYGIEVSKAQEHLLSTVDEAYNRTMYDIQRGTGYGFSFAQVSTDTANEILKNDWSGKSYSERVWNNTQRVASLIKNELFVGEMVGKSNHEMSAVIMEKMGVGAMAARRLVRTETCYVANQAEMESYKECDIEKYRFIAVLDLQTSEMCVDLDGQTFPVSKQQPGVNCPPMHPNCRSTTIACFDDDNLAELKRRARDPVTGKNVIVPADMTYKDWKKLQEDTYGEKQIALRQKMIYNRVADRKQYERYKSFLGKNAPKTFFDFQSIKYSDDWDAFKSYGRSIKSGELTPLANFDLYKDISLQIDEQLVGQKTSNGISISGKSKHFIARTIGSVEQRRNGVDISVTLSTLLNPVRVDPVKHNDNGDSQRFIGDGAAVTINPNTGKLIQVNPLKNLK